MEGGGWWRGLCCCCLSCNIIQAHREGALVVDPVASPTPGVGGKQVGEVRVGLAPAQMEEVSCHQEGWLRDKEGWLRTG